MKRFIKVPETGTLQKSLIVKNGKLTNDKIKM